MAHGRRSSGRRADYTWNGLSGQVASLDLAEGVVGLGDAHFDFEEAQTLVRVRGAALVQLDAGGVDERAMIALGIIVVNDQAATAGVGSIPTPGTEPLAPWVWHTYVGVSSGAEAAVVEDGLIARVVIDSKAMRKVKANEALVFVAEIAQSVDQTGSVDILYGLRALVSL